jgi:alanyl-tRNA synthetase
VTNTKDIGCFVIVSQESVSAGIKRIVALTGPKVFEHFQEKNQILDSLAQKFSVTQKQVVDKTEKMIKELELLQNAYGMLENKLVADTLRRLVNKTNNSDLELVLEVPSDVNFKTALIQSRKIFENQNFLIYNKE